MHRIVVLGTGLIGRSYSMSLQNFRRKDEIKIIASGTLEVRKNLRRTLKWIP